MYNIIINKIYALCVYRDSLVWGNSASSHGIHSILGSNPMGLPPVSGSRHQSGLSSSHRSAFRSYNGRPKAFREQESASCEQTSAGRSRYESEAGQLSHTRSSRHNSDNGHFHREQRLPARTVVHSLIDRTSREERPAHISGKLALLH